MWKAIFAVPALLILSGAYAADSPSPPIAEKHPVELENFGNTRVDEYFWLNQRDNPEVIEYLEAENSYADAILAKSSGLQQRLVKEMKGRIKEDDSSAPYRHGDYLYYERYEPGKEYPIYCRRKNSITATEEILLDVNEIAGDEKYFSVQGVRVSPDHKTLAYAFDTQGRRFYNLRFIDLETGRHLDDAIDDVTPYFAWSSDGQSIVYVRQDPQTLRWFRAYRHDLGEKGAQDQLLYEETDTTFSIYPYKSLSGKYIYLLSSSTLATEVRYMPADKLDDGFKVFLPREAGHEYFVSDGVDRFYIVSNKNAENFRVLQAPIDNTAEAEWDVVIPNRDDVLVETIDVFAGQVVVSGMSRGSSVLEVLDRTDDSLRRISFDEDAFLAYTDDNFEYRSGSVRFVYESMTTPESVFDYDFKKQESVLVKQQEVPGYSPGDYHSERLYAEARDGTMIPVSLVYRKGMELDGSNPLLQYGYGSYGSSIVPDFDANLVSLLDRGFIFAIAHIRGGSEMGRRWYYEGRQLNKMNTFTDFIDVSRFLIKEGYTSPRHLYARGGSAGGLLMGAIVNMAPELYNGVSTRVPFVDVVTTMLDDSIPLTSSEWDEWGDPRDKTDYEYMLSYSPYDQISSQDYPNILVTTGLHDSQVQYWEPAKWVARLRDRKTDDNLLILKTDMQAGHSGKTGRFQSLEDDALYYTFFLQLEGMAE